jgi:hypothetical protein
MEPPSKLARAIAYGLGITLLAFACLSLWMAFAMRSVRVDFRFSQADWEPFATTLKSTLSNFFVIKRAAAGSDQIRFPNLQHNPEAVRGNAKLFDAWMESLKLGSAALKNTPRGNWVSSSAGADYVAPQDRVDPWNHTFCLLRRGDDVLIMSGGPRAPSSPACLDIQIRADDLARLPHGKLLESPAGYLVLVVDRTHADYQNLPQG